VRYEVEILTLELPFGLSGLNNSATIITMAVSILKEIFQNISECTNVIGRTRSQEEGN
jgi:hypothetical protein